jgi:hypothetical protein
MEIKSRVCERHKVGLPTSCRFEGETTEESIPAEIRDVSTSGVGLLFERRFEPGAILSFLVPETAYNLPPFMNARVVHASALPGGQWLHGCAFVQALSEEELQRFLGQGKPAEEPVPAQPEPAQPEPAPLKPVLPPTLGLNALVVDQVFASWFGRVQGGGR